MKIIKNNTLALFYIVDLFCLLLTVLLNDVEITWFHQNSNVIDGFSKSYCLTVGMFGIILTTLINTATFFYGLNVNKESKQIILLFAFLLIEIILILIPCFLVNVSGGIAGINELHKYNLLEILFHFIML